MLHQSRRMGSSNRPWNPLSLSTRGLSTHKARRASAGWGAAKQLACQSRGPPPATRKAVFPVPGPATRDPNRGVTNRWRAGWSRPDQPKHRLGHSGDPDLLDGGVDRSSSGRPAMPHPPAVHLSGAHRPGAPHGARRKRHSGQGSGGSGHCQSSRATWGQCTDRAMTRFVQD
jgi:hypothetical protein